MVDTATAIMVVWGIIGGTGYAVASLVMRTSVKKLELQRQIAQPQAAVDSDELRTVKEELAALRETSTQFDVSLQNALERIDHRLEHVENKVNVVGETQAEPLARRVMGR
jgi:tetrahydromethanopterin S-methyltransferase subunit G